MRYALVLLAIMTIAKPLISQTQVLLPLKKNGKFGFVNGSGDWVIDPVFERVSYFKSDVAYGLRNDSLYVINSKSDIRFLNGFRDMVNLSDGNYFLQNSNGKWAVADSNLNPQSEFEFDRVSFQNGYYFVYKDNRFGVMDSLFKMKLPIELINGKFINPNLFFGMADKQKIYYSVPENFKIIFTGDNVFTFPDDNVNLFSRRKNLITMYDLKGDSIFSCNKCKVSDYVNNMVEFTDHETEFIVDAVDGSLIYKLEISELGIIASEKRSPGFFWNIVSKEFIAGNHSGISFPDSLHFDYYVYMDTSVLMLYVNDKVGIYDYRGYFVLDTVYDDFMEPSTKLICGYKDNRLDIFRRSDFVKLKTTPVAQSISATDYNILLSFSGKSAVLYQLDSTVSITDSIRFRDLTMIKLGSGKASKVRTGIVGINSQASNWFRFNNRIGLLNPGNDKDTLIKPVFNNVQTLNDTLDFVSLDTKMFRILVLEKGADLLSFNKFGIINNRTGKFVVRPVFPYMQYNMASVNNCDVIRVVLPNCKFALLDLKNFRVIPESVCDYITPLENNYMRMMYSPKFIQKKVTFSNNLFFRYKKLCSSIVFSDGFTLRGIDATASVYCFSNGVNIADIKGKISFDKKECSVYSFMDEGKYGRFITYDKNDNAGVVSHDAGKIVDFSFNKITRLPQNDSFFILNNFNTRYGYVNDRGFELTIPVFSNAKPFAEGYAWSSINDSVYLVDSTGNYTYQYQGKLNSKDFYDGIGAVKVNGNWALVDGSGQLIGDINFRDVKPFVNGVAAARSKKGWGIINENGDFIVEPKYQRYECQNSNSIVLRNIDKCYFFDLSGNLGGEAKVNGKIKPLGDNYYMESYDNVRRVYYSNGEPYKNGKKFKSDLFEFNDSLLLIRESRIKVFDSEGKVADRVKHKMGIGGIKKGIMHVADGSNRSSVYTIEVTPSMIMLYPDLFKPGMENFTVTKPFGIGNSRIVNSYMPDCYRLNAFIFRSNDGCYLSDSLGNLLIDLEFYSIEYNGNNYFKVAVKNSEGSLLYGIIDNYGLWILPPKYDRIDRFQSGIAVYGMRSDYYLTDMDGNLVTLRELMSLEHYQGYILLVSENGSAWWKINDRIITEFSK